MFEIALQCNRPCIFLYNQYEVIPYVVRVVNIGSKVIFSDDAKTAGTFVKIELEQTLGVPSDMGVYQACREQ